MVDLVRVEYAKTGKSSFVNSMGMREMQARAFEARDAQYLLLKAPPASGKSRALMFLGLDKLKYQGIKKVIVAVPETSIGSSFKDVRLTDDGFFSDWHVEDRNNLCVGGEAGKVISFIDFIKHPTDQTLVCTHATLRFAYEKLKPSDFDGTLVAIDEFHHVSAGEESKLGQLIDGLIKGSNAHIVAMTGSYFRGDAVPILLPEDEALFKQVTYSYYEQLNGYQYLKSLGIGYHFYKGRYLDALHEVLDPNKKTIIHIPNVNAVESTKDKYREVEDILDVIGTNPVKDSRTGMISIKAPNGKILKVADLVDDNEMRSEVQKYLRGVQSADDVDIIIALGMAKEGFDWPWCEHVLTIGYRSSMTEIVQIIGRATRDCEGKSHAQFTNLIAQPDAEDDDVKISVNNMLKAITVSLLMENVLAPNINFRPRSRLLPDEQLPPGTVIIEDITAPVSDKLLQALDNLDNIRAALVQKPEVAAAVIVETPPEVINEVELPKIIETLYPDLTPSEVDTVKEAILTQIVVQKGGGLFRGEELPPGADVYVPPGTKTPTGEPVDINSLPKTGQQFVKMGNKFINIEHLNIDLISQVNPFQGAYEILSKAFTAQMLKSIQEVVVGMRATVTDEEAVIFWPKIEEFFKEHGKEPSITSSNPLEKRYAEVLAFMRRKKQEGMSKNGN
jgi:Helicase conserved C-terminal domain